MTNHLYRNLLLVALFAAFFANGQLATADTNLLAQGGWVVDGTDDTGPNPSGIAMTIRHRDVGTFSELVISYNVDGVGVVAVATIKGTGEIRLALPPPGEFGGSFYTTGYWDCERGYIPATALTDLDIRVKGGRNPQLEFRGKCSNGLTMAARDLRMTVFPPDANLVRLQMGYALRALQDFCVDHLTHTNAENFQIARMAANYLSAETNENDQTRYIKLTGRDCSPIGCSTSTKSYCNNLVNQDELIVDQDARLGAGRMSLLHTQAIPRQTPSLDVRFNLPTAGRVHPQGQITTSADPNAQNASFWGNWQDVRAVYRKHRLVGRFKYFLEVTPPGSVPCDETN